MESAFVGHGWESVVDMTEHIVILATTLKNLVFFVAALRQPSILCRPILIVCDQLCSPAPPAAERLWREISRFPEIFVLNSEASTSLIGEQCRLATVLDQGDPNSPEARACGIACRGMSTISLTCPRRR